MGVTTERPTRKTFSTIAAACAFLAFGIASSTVPAQNKATGAVSAEYVPTMTFDVASIREMKTNPMAGIIVGGGFQPPNSGNLTLQNFTLGNLIRRAYPGGDHKFDGIQTLPVRLRIAYFDVIAKADSSTNDKLAKLPAGQMRLEQAHMVQVLLAERFRLEVHWETRDSSTYDLIVTNPKRLQTTGAPPSADEIKRFGDSGVPPLYTVGGSVTGFEFIAHGATAADIVEALTLSFGAPVTDKTGLTGKYDFDLHYFNVRASAEDAADPAPPLQTAIQDQLGLKLVPSHGPVRFLVIDHAEMPSAN
jgi:uncharacterized protein (TIGR03435 family)